MIFVRLQIDMTSEVPIYKQIRDQIVYGAATGALSPGERLPTVRQLAADIGVNPMTVNKAYALLKSEGVIAVDRRHGAQVCEKDGANLLPSADFDRRAKLLIAEAKAGGVPQAQLEKRLLELTSSVYENKEASK